MRRDLVAIVCAQLASCASAQPHAHAAGCVGPADEVDSVRLTLHDEPVSGAPSTATTHLAPPCPTRGESSIASPIELTATEDGLVVSFEVIDPSFHPGTYRQLGGERDSVAVFPSGESPGRPLVELAMGRTPRGYRVEDTVPWGTWGLRGPSGTFRFVCAMFDREAGGSETETRIAVHITVQRAP